MIEKMKKLKTFDETFSVENHDRKERKKVNQNKCGVSSQKTPYEKRRGRYRSGVSPYLAAGCFVHLQAGPAASPRKHSTLQESPIKYHKCPTFDANRNAGDFQIKQMLQKDAAESENRLKHNNVNCFIAYF